MAGVARGEVGVKLQALLTTAAVPTTVPSIETVTVSPLTPVPAMAGSAVVVSVLPLAGLAMVGAAGAIGRATVKVSVAASRTRAAGGGLGRGDLWLALLGRGRREAPGAVDHRGGARDRSIDRTRDRVAADPGPGNGRLGRRRVGAAIGRAGDRRGRRGRRQATVKVSVAAVELGPPAAAWVAEIVWLALLRGEVGVKLQALLTTAAVPATVPSIETVTGRR